MRDHRRILCYWPLAVALALFALAVTLIAVRSASLADGRLLYIFDDAWIQLAIAKNLVQHGVWGVSPDSFASASSSPLWCLLLAAIFAVVGVWEHAAWVLNLFSAAGVLVLADFILRRWQVAPRLRLAILLVVAAAAPLHGIVFVGMEHSLHSLLQLGFLWLAAEELAASGLSVSSWWLPLLALLLPITRYEGFFAVGLACLGLVIRRRFGRAALIFTLALAPVAAFGVVSEAKGWHFLPNSILLKGGLITSSVWTLFEPFRFSDYENLWKHPDLLLLVLASGLIFLYLLRRDGTVWRVPTLMVIFTALCLLAQVRYGALGWLFRYEVYVLVSSLFALGLAIGSRNGGRLPPLQLHPAGWAGLSLLAVFLSVPFVIRAETATVEALEGGHARLLSHVLPAELVASYYPTSTVVLNDIGAVAFASEARILDLVGLASQEPLRLGRKPGGMTQEDVRAWTEASGAAIAIRQGPWESLDRATPESWVLVATVRVRQDLVYRNRRLRFYACRPELAQPLRRQIQELLEPRYRRLGAQITYD